MKTRVKTTKKTKKWYDHDYWVRKHPKADAWINLMTFIRSVMMMRGIDTIVKDAVKYANERGERARLKYVQSQDRMRHCLKVTEKAVKKGGPTSVKAHRYTVRLWAGQNRRSGRGGPHGFTTAIGNGPNLLLAPVDCIPVMLHELTHTIHLTSVQEISVNGKRRPHDICYNRIQLKLMQKVFKLTEKELNTHPKYHGYSVGNGYAPSKSAFRILNKLIEDQDPRVMKWFTAEQPVVKEKKKRGPSKTAWLNTMTKVICEGLAYWPDDTEELNVFTCYEWMHEIRPKIEAGIKLTEDELKTLASSVDEVEEALNHEQDAGYWNEGTSATRFDGRIKTMNAGHRWWLENVQMQDNE